LITGKILKVFDKVLRNWAVVGELMNLPVDIISSPITKSSITRFFFQSVELDS